MSETSPGNLILSMQNPDLYDHPVDGFQVIETHISQVILTGDYAYKIKKPMDFGFLNFSTLDRRKHFCEEELRLNRRLAEKLYLEVVPITGTPDAPILGGEGEAFEYAIKMRQFGQDQLFDRLQEQGQLPSDLLTDLARQVAGFHDQLPPVPDDKPLGTPEAVFAAMQENFDQIRPLIDDPDLLMQLDNLQAWTESTFERQRDLIAHRRANGMVRECHGDLHLANITRFDGEVTVFDCIEFNEPFRWIDVINDLAFLLMDLESRGRALLPIRCSILIWNIGTTSKRCHCCHSTRPIAPWSAPRLRYSPWAIPASRTPKKPTLCSAIAAMHNWPRITAPFLTTTCWLPLAFLPAARRASAPRWPTSWG